MHYLTNHPMSAATMVGQHIELCAAALAIAIAIGVPLGVFSARKPVVGGALLAVLGILYTIPSLALFALLIPILGLGFWTAVAGLAAYAQMVLVRNVAAGLRGVPASIVDAARGMGMTAWQIFWHVERPLAMPVVIGGLRIAAVTVIGIANIAAWINAGGMGTLLFGGIYQDNPDKIVAGATLSAVLALSVDAALRAIEHRYRVATGSG